MADQTPHLGLPYLAAAQAQKHVTLNESLQRLDSIVQLAVLDRDLSAPPTSPVEGARYIVAAGASGAWAGHDSEIAVWQDGAWAFLVPKEGWLAWVSDEDKLVGWTTTAWAEVVGGGGGGAVTFLDLTDTPAAYTGQGAKFVRVNTGETALEFTDPPGVGGEGVTTFIELTDTPASYSGQNGKSVRVNSGATALEFYTPSAPGSTTFTGLTDTPASYSGQNSKSVRVNSGATALEFYTPPAPGSTTFTGLTDTPGSYTGKAGNFVRVNSTANRLEFVAPPASGSTTFTGLTDTPGSYSGQAGKALRVNAGQTGLEFTDQFSLLGVNTAPSSTDRLSVASASSRFTHTGSGGHQLKLNKAAAADTASVVFQRADSGRAEFGLVASDTFQLKVSANGSAWVVGMQFNHTSGDVSFGGGGAFAGGLGVGGASPDASNRLVVNGAASLLNHAGAGHQLKINKAGASDSASVVFQKGFSGRAEFGLVASDTFQLKVSADGAAWITALQFDGTTGKETLTTNVPLGDNAYEHYNNGILRVATRSNGITTWTLNSGNGEVGSIAYTTPSGYPGIAIQGPNHNPPTSNESVLIIFESYNRLTFQFRTPTQTDVFEFLDTGQVNVDGATVLTSSRHPVLRSYSKSSLPSASPAGQLIYVSNDAAGPTVAFSDGTTWRRVHDRNVVA